MSDLSIDNLSPESRVWIYQINRTLNQNELASVSSALKEFCMDWTAHNQALKATFSIPYARFIVLVVDETRTGASGCSIDKSVKFLKALSEELQIDVFDRMQMAYLDRDTIKTIHYTDIQNSLKSGQISKDSLFFNPRAETLQSFRDAFLLPLNQHWLSRNISL